ncbi:MAG: hypothetical protein JXR56_09665 [Candidatus Cloacimonetes bacterium]|nr:hypothetical protein [Candidatus Cloacimonadota bacterium]
MQPDLSGFPGFISIPYRLSRENGIQKRDYQRMCVESLLRFLASICICNYVKLFKTGNSTSNLPSPRGIDLSQVSLGRWNMIARTLSRLIVESGFESFIPEISQLYDTKSDWENLVSSYINARNQDAHGGLILDESELTKELDRRQEIVAEMLSRCSFLNNYRTVLPYETLSTTVGVSYKVKSFPHGVTIISSQLQPIGEMELNKPYLISNVDNSTLCMYPMFIQYPSADSDPRYQQFTYYRTMNRKTGILQFMNSRQLITIRHENKDNKGYQSIDSVIAQDFFNLRLLIEDESLLQETAPSLQIKYSFEDDFITKQQSTTINISIKNNGDAIAEDVCIELQLPKSFVIPDDGEQEHEEVGEDYYRIRFSDIDLESAGTWKKQLCIRPNRSGQYEFPALRVTYSYSDVRGKLIKPKQIKDGTFLNTEFSESIFCTVIDPTDIYSIIPVVNMSVKLDYGYDITGAIRDDIRIGDSISLSVFLRNTGLGVAKDVDFTVFLPEGIRLKSGKETWHGNINPRSSEQITFELELLKAGIMYIRFRELVYYDYQGEVYSTFHGGYKLLVRNNPMVELRQQMQKAWGDLILSEEEELQLKLIRLRYKNLPEMNLISMEELETEVKVSILKQMIRATAESMDITLVEKAFGKGFDLFAISDLSCPFAIIQYWQNEVNVYLQGDFQSDSYPREKIYIKHELPAFMYHKIDAFSSKIDSNLFRGLLGRSIRWVLRNIFPLYLCKQAADKILGLYSANTEISIEGHLAIYRIHGDLPYNHSYPFHKAFFCFNKKMELCILISTSGFSTMTKDVLAIDEYQFYSYKDKFDSFPFLRCEKGGKYLMVQEKKAVTHGEVEDVLIAFQQFVLDLLQIKSLSLKHHISIFSDTQKDYLRKIVTTFDKCYKDYSEKSYFRGWFLRFLKEDNKTHIDFYSIKAFPIFKAIQKTIRISVSPRRITVNVRGLPLDFAEYQEISCSLSKTPPYLYAMNYTAKVDNSLNEIITYNLGISNLDIQPLSSDILSRIISESRIRDFEVFLHSIYRLQIDGSQTSFSSLNSLLEQQGVMRTTQKFISASTRYFSHHILDYPLNYSFKERTLSIKPIYLPLIEQLISN